MAHRHICRCQKVWTLIDVVNGPGTLKELQRLQWDGSDCLGSGRHSYLKLAIKAKTYRALEYILRCPRTDVNAFIETVETINEPHTASHKMTALHKPYLVSTKEAATFDDSRNRRKRGPIRVVRIHADIRTKDYVPCVCAMDTSSCLCTI